MRRQWRPVRPPAGAPRTDFLTPAPPSPLHLLPGPEGPEEGISMLYKAHRKATEIATASLELYREMALSALRLVPGRR